MTFSDAQSLELTELRERQQIENRVLCWKVKFKHCYFTSFPWWISGEIHQINRPIWKHVFLLRLSFLNSKNTFITFFIGMLKIRLSKEISWYLFYIQAVVLWFPSHRQAYRCARTLSQTCSEMTLSFFSSTNVNSQALSPPYPQLDLILPCGIKLLL